MRNNKRQNTIVFVAGGTSGHIHPALAIAGEIKRHREDLRIVFCGLKGNLEEEMVPAAGYEFKAITAHGMPSKYSPRFFRWIKDNIKGIYTSKKILKNLKPLLIVGTGGYVTGPVLAAARMLGIPYFLHEQNVFPGRANRFFANAAEKVFVINEESKSYFKNKSNLIVSGNPVQSQFYSLNRKIGREALGIAEDRFLVVITGGSLGASTLNTAVKNLRDNRDWRQLLEEYPEIMIMLSSGKEQSEPSEIYEGIDHVQVTDYLYNMAQWMAAADLIVSRSGAMTCAEIVALGRPSILVPYPYAADDHQSKNAKSIADLGGALMVKDENFTSEYLINTLRLFMNEPQKIKAMQQALSSVDKVPAVEIIYKELAPYFS